MSWRVWVGRPMVSLKTMPAADCTFRRCNSFEHHFRVVRCRLFIFLDLYPAKFYPLISFPNKVLLFVVFPPPAQVGFAALEVTKVLLFIVFPPLPRWGSPLSKSPKY